MSEVFYRNPRNRWFCKMVGTIPVALRGGNRDAIRAARAALERGDVVGVFPEGGISRDGAPYLGQAGAVSLVLSTRVPVVAAGISGAREAHGFDTGFPRRGPITVRFGDPMTPEQLVGTNSGSHKERLKRATTRIMNEIAALSGQTSREVDLQRLRNVGSGALSR